MEERTSFSPHRYLAGRWETIEPAASTAPRSVSLVTWNVWFGGHMFAERRDALLADLQRRSPDVIALQEVTGELLEAVMDAPWVRAHYCLSHTSVLAYDVVVLSRLPVRRMVELPLPSEMGRRLVIADLACGLSVGTVHLESMSGYEAARAEQLRRIQPLLASRSDSVLVGDMNFKPDDPLETAALDPSFLDVWPALRPGDPGYTVDTDINLMRLMVNDKPTHKRIDRVFLRSPRWLARAIELTGTRAIDTEDTFTSDHFGLAVELGARN